MGNVNIAPFAAKVVAERPGEFALWWEDPRDITRVEVAFTRPVTAESLPRIEYWQDNWPRVHVPANAVVGSGREGWLPIDDWIAGHWQPASSHAEGDGRSWAFRFNRLSEDDIPKRSRWDDQIVEGCSLAPIGEAVFRRTLKLRLVDEGMPAVEAVAVYSDSEWREADVCLEWGGLTSRDQCWDGHLEAYNGEVLAVTPLCGDVELQSDGSWTSTVGATTAGVRARVRYAWNEDRNS